MKFLRKAGVAFFAPLVINVMLVYLGFHTSVASFFCFVTFLWLNGLHYLRLAYKTIPRDISFLLKAISLTKKSKEIGKLHPYVSDVFQHNVRQHPNKVALIFEERKLTFEEIDVLSNKIANMLLSSTNLQRGDCVAVFMENSPEYIAIYLALSKIGVTSALINCNLRGKGLTHCIKISKCSGIIFDCSLSEGLSSILGDLDSSITQALFSVGGDSPITGANNLERKIGSVSSKNPPALTNKSPKDLLSYIYTSGTTGWPKPCNIYHSRAVTMTCLFQVMGKLVLEDIVYSVLPLYHTSGMNIGVGSMVIHGNTVVLRRKFSASNFSKDCSTHKCTVFIYIGELCRYLMAQPVKSIDQELNIRIFIGNGLRGNLWSPLKERFNIQNILEFYGATEGNVFLGNLVNKPGAVGYEWPFLSFIPHHKLIKVDVDTADYVRDEKGLCVIAGVNEPGELVAEITARTPFNGYKDSTATKKKVLTDVFRKGDRYFLSGDMMRKDEEGFLYFCDRMGDSFRWKGENVSTTEVENAIARIYKSQTIVVYGVEIPRKEGRAGMAAIEGTPDSLDLSDFAKQLSDALPKYAVPIFLRFIPEVKLTGTFKLKKVELRGEGFDVKAISDPLYFFDNTTSSYVPLTEDLCEEIAKGTLKL